ncbi:MAG TPA: DMT family transporter [Candidatus Limnocylindria bacterium]|nr:DMT family transporter [Candidatus Limnocylindria bacterium]
MSLRVVAAYVVMILLWGTTWGAIKIGVSHVPAWLFALERAIAVAAVLTVASLVLRLEFPRRRTDLFAAGIAGILNIGLTWALIFWAEQFVPSGVVAVFGATAPVWTAFLAHFLVKGDRLSAAKVAALALGLVGTAVLVGPPGDASGDHVILALILLAAVMPIAWAAAAIIAARRLAALSPIPVIALECWAGALVLIPFAAADAGRPSDWSADAVVSFLYLVIGGSCVGLVLNLWLFRRLRPTTVMLSQILIPVQAVIIGTVALAEPVDLRMLAGALLVFAAIAVNAVAGARTAREEPVAAAP